MGPRSDNSVWKYWLNLSPMEKGRVLFPETSIPAREVMDDVPDWCFCTLGLHGMQCCLCAQLPNLGARIDCGYCLGCGTNGRPCPQCGGTQLGARR